MPRDEDGRGSAGICGAAATTALTAEKDQIWRSGELEEEGGDGESCIRSTGNGENDSIH
jgi:hypothetical protein